jgi:hypothetical protein
VPRRAWLAAARPALHPRLGPLWLAAVVLAIYLPDLGQGFIKDDFAWIRSSRLGGPGDLVRLVTEPASGFFRPLVALSFAANVETFDLHAFGYGVTNLALLGACAAGLWRLAAALGLAPGARLVAAAIFCLNFHGIHLALLWISGRTALLLCATATWAAVAAVRGRPLRAGVLAFAAMLSKEEAVALPLVFAAWAALRADGGSAATRVRAALHAAWPSGLALVVYGVLRSRTAAMTFATAPSFYQARLDASGVASNVLEYLDRSTTLAAAVTLVACLVARRLPRLDAADRRRLALAAIWVAAMFAITVWLPVRSSLYAVTPSIGTALAASLVIARVWDGVGTRTARLAIAGALLLPLALWPVYHARNQRLANEARLSAMVMRTLAPLRDAAPASDGAVFVDDPRARPSLYHAFGPHLPDAVALAIGRSIPVSLDNTPGAGLSGPTPNSPSTRRFRLENGRLIDAR